MSYSVNSDLVWKGNEAKKATDTAISKALEMSAILVSNAAVKNAPMDTGLLKASITRDFDDKNAYIGTGLEYAPYVEFGTRKQKAQPYLRPALLLNIDKIKRIFGKLCKGVKFID